MGYKNEAEGWEKANYAVWTRAERLEDEETSGALPNRLYMSVWITDVLYNSFQHLWTASDDI